MIAVHTVPTKKIKADGRLIAEANNPVKIKQVPISYPPNNVSHIRLNSMVRIPKMKHDMNTPNEPPER